MPSKRTDKILLRSTSYEAKTNKQWEVPLSVEELPDAKNSTRDYGHVGTK